MFMLNVFHFIQILDLKLDFNKHINNVLSKVNKIIVLLPKYQYILLRHSFLTIYKAFVRPESD